MEALSGQTGIGLFVAVDHITQKGMADGSHVDTDLMGASGFQTALDMGIAGKTLQHAPVGNGMTAVSGIDGHALAVYGVTTDGGVHGAGVLTKAAYGNGLVNAGQRVVLKLLGQSQVRFIVEKISRSIVFH
jgi:hypothetical protein